MTNHSKMIIGLVGFAGSGKDSVADILIERHGYRKDSLAAPLKDAVSAIFGWDREMLEGSTAESRVFREQVDSYWAEALGIKNLTPRMVLQQVGTEVFRRNFHDDIWCASLRRRIEQSPHQHIVITDCRFPNEIQLLRDIGGFIIQVERHEPPWLTTAIRALFGDEAATREMEYLAHPSEWHWFNCERDAFIDNTGEFDDLGLRTAEALVRLFNSQ